MQIFKLIFSVFLFTNLVGCTTIAPLPTITQTTPSTEQSHIPEVSLKKQISELINLARPNSFTETTPINVYYVTNRKANDKTTHCSNASYDIDISAEVSYGICRINVPKKHSTGKIEFDNNFTSDSDTYFKVMSHKKMEFDNFQKTIISAPTQEILVFIHGFNVKFQDAILRASQLAYDLKFQGPVILFSWPAGSDSGLISGALISRTYLKNRALAQQSVNAAIDFFDLISRLNIKTNIYIHSMGHQVAIPALTKLSKNTEVKLLVDELILNAPDFDLIEFKSIAPSLVKLANRVTLYCSYNDSAMLASETLNGNKRLGACEKIENIDVINVSEIDSPSLGMGLGHGYYSSRAVLTDVAQLLMGLKVENRLFIRASNEDGKENYFLRP